MHMQWNRWAYSNGAVVAFGHQGTLQRDISPPHVSLQASLLTTPKAESYLALDLSLNWTMAYRHTYQRLAVPR